MKKEAWWRSSALFGFLVLLSVALPLSLSSLNALADVVERQDQIVVAQASSGQATAKEGQKPNANLETGTWTAIEVRGDAISERFPTLKFEKGWRIFGYSGCNRFIGNSSHDEKTMSFSSIGLTRKKCYEWSATQEEKFISALGSTKTYRVDGDALTLMGESGVALVRLKRGS